ncbi:MAG: hypothetical protein RR940_04115, partial [Bacilli bacterium]
NELYYKMLNINKDNDETLLLMQINQIISEEMSQVQLISASTEGLCKLISHNIYEKLIKQKICASIFNTNDLLGIKEHEAIIVSYFANDHLSYILIDPAYTQFINNGNACLFTPSALWPSDILKTINPLLLSILLNNNYSQVSYDSFNDYLTSLTGQSTIKTNIDPANIMINNKRL